MCIRDRTLIVLAMMTSDTTMRMATINMPLTDGSAVEITTAVYNPPTSPSFDGEGVRPDFRCV